MWAMMQKFRMTAGSVLPGTGAALFEDTKGFRGDVEDGTPILPRGCVRGENVTPD
jgi:hypothetical protein